MSRRNTAVEVGHTVLPPATNQVVLFTPPGNDSESSATSKEMFETAMHKQRPIRVSLRRFVRVDLVRRVAGICARDDSFDTPSIRCSHGQHGRTPSYYRGMVGKQTVEILDKSSVLPTDSRE